jgi:hypothetical protein
VNEPIPVCAFCDEPVTSQDRQGQHVGSAGGVHQTHYECGLRSVLGGIGHMTNHAHWCVEVGDTDAGMSYRDSAREVLRIVHEVGVEEASRRSFDAEAGDCDG